METEIQLPDGKSVTLVHEGDLTDDAIRNAVEQMGYDLPMRKEDIMRNIAGEGSRIAGAVAGTIRGSKYGPVGGVLGGLAGAAAVEPLARALTPREETSGESVANIALAGIQPEVKAAGLGLRLLRGAGTGALLGAGHTTVSTLVDEKRLPSLSELAPSAVGGAALGGILEGAIGPRLAKPVETPAVVPPVTKEGSITAALDKRKPSNLSVANAQANEIATGGATPPAASAQAVPAPTPIERSTAAPAATEAPSDFVMPKELAGAKPRYSYGDKQFGLEFESDLDRALYILAQSNPSKRDADYLKAVVEHSGLSEGELRAAGKRVRDTIKSIAKNSDDEIIQVPEIGLPKKAPAQAPKRVSIDDADAIDAAATAQAPKEAPETITSAAVKFSDGEIQTGKNHAEIVDRIGDNEPTIERIRGVLTDGYKNQGRLTNQAIASRLGVTTKQFEDYFAKSKKSLMDKGGFEEAAQHFLSLAKEASKDLRGSDDGFVTSTGRYVDRQEAMKIARKSGQLTDQAATNVKIAEPGSPGEKLNVESLKPIEKPLPPEALITHQKIGDKSFTQIDIPNPAGGRPLFSGSVGDAIKEGYKFDLPKEVPQGRTTFGELVGLEDAAKAPKKTAKAPMATRTPKTPESPAKANIEAVLRLPPDTPVGAVVHMGEEPEMRVRNLAKRVIESDLVPLPTREVLAKDPSILYERHRHRAILDRGEAATDSDLRQLIADAKDHDEGIIYRRELANRLIKDKKFDEAAAVFADQAQMLTPNAQALASARLIRTSIGDLHEIEEKVARLGRQLTKEQKEKVLELSSKEIHAQKQVNLLEKRAKEFFSKENLNAFREAQVEHAKALAAFDEYSATIAPRDFPDMLVKMVQGNLLTPLSIAANVFGNMFWAPLERTSMALSSAMDAIVTTSMKGLAGKDSALAKRSISASNPLPSQMELAALADGVRVAAKELLTGPSQESYIKSEVQRGFRPLRSLIDSITGENLARDSEGMVKPWDRAKAFIEGTLGVPPEIMFRLLSIGDKPFRRAATVRAFLEQARLKGIKDADLERFMALPDAKTKEVVDKATRRSIFAEENTGITTLNRFLDSDMAKLLRVDKIPVLKGALKVFGRLTVPFRQFPVNYALTALNFAAPQLALSKSVYYGYKSAAVLRSKTMTAQGIAQAVLDNRRKSLSNLGEAAMGIMMYSAAAILWNQGLISESSADTSAKRSDQSEAMGASKLNVTGLDRYMKGEDASYRKGDTLVDWTRAGIPAVVFHIYTQQKSKERDEGAKIGHVPEKSDTNFLHRTIDNAVSSAPGLGSFIFDQSFLAGTSSLMDAIKDADPDSPKFQNWMNNMWKAVTSIAVPNTIDSISRARMEYVPELRGATELETLGNIWKHKVMGLPADMEGLVLKRDTWGRPIPRTPAGANPYVYGLADVTKAGHQIADPHDQKLYDLYSETNRPSVYPDPIGRTVTYNGVTVELDPQDVEKLQETIGTMRRDHMEQFVDSPIYEKLDPFEKVLALEKIYQGANELGKKKFTASSSIYQKYFSSNPDKKTTSRTTEAILLGR